MRPLGNRYAYTKVELDEARVIGASCGYYDYLDAPTKMELAHPK